MRHLQRSRSVGVLSKQTQETPFPSMGKRSFFGRGEEKRKYMDLCCKKV